MLLLGEQRERHARRRMLPGLRTGRRGGTCYVIRRMGLSNAERLRRFRERRKEQQPRIHYRRPQDRRSRPQRWRDAVQTLVDLQAEYQDWLDGLPPNLEGSTVAERPEAICEYDFGDLEALEPPKGFGRD